LRKVSTKETHKRLLKPVKVINANATELVYQTACLKSSEQHALFTANRDNHFLSPAATRVEKEPGQ
jgi:hypothetical protein